MLSQETTKELSESLDKFIASAESGKDFCEIMKKAFGETDESSNASWARSDLASAMRKKSDDGAEYLRCYWEGITRLSEHENLPDQDYFNAILEANNDPFRIDGETIRQDLGDITLLSSSAGTDNASPQLTKEFILGEIVGEGGFGTVFKLKKTTAIGDFEFAIKILHPSPFVNSNNSPERFKREISLLNSLQHRSVVQIIESGYLSNGKAYYLMPFIKGPNLRDATEGLSSIEVINLMMEVCHGIEFMHANGIYHRDLKPSNVLVRETDRQPIVLDFGCAFSLDFLDQNSLTEYAVGSLAYMPPEVLRNPKHRTQGHDIFSLGVVLYECLARSLPATESYIPLSGQNSVLAPIDEIVLKALRPETQRYSTVTEFREGLISARDRL